jgi:hypothetical protein
VEIKMGTKLRAKRAKGSTAPAATIKLVPAAGMIGVHWRTLRNWVLEGKASADRGKRNSYLFTPAEVLRLKTWYWTPPALNVPQQAAG